MADKEKEATADTKPGNAEAAVKADASTEKTTDTSATEVEQLKADKAKAEQEAQASATQLAAEQKARQDLEGRVAAMEKDARATRFKEIAKDWSGDRAYHLDMLEMIATTEKDGEKSARFTKYVEHENAVAEQLRQSALFRETGSSAAVEGSAAAELEKRARKMADESGGKLTYHQAYDQILQSDAALAARVAQEEKLQVN